MFRPKIQPKIQPIFSLVLLRDYLVKVGSKLADDVITTPLSTILDQMELYTGPKENRLAAMMFCETPSKFFPYTQRLLELSIQWFTTCHL